MKYGVVFPQTEFPSDPIAIRDFAQAVEGLGYAHLLAYDHVLGANPEREGGWSGPYTCQDPFQEPLTLFSYLAGVTSQLAFVTGVIILPQRQTALVAKQAATLDVLSGGRLRLGVGLGWNEVEYTSLNENFHNRGKRFEEQVEVLRALWTQPLVTYSGKWHTIQDAGLNPLPVQQPIPLWFGGHADPVLRRTAKMADGWLPNHRTAQDAAEALSALQKYLAAEGRPLESLGIEPRLNYSKTNAKLWLPIITGWQSAGATHLTLITMGAGLATPEAHLKAVEEFAEVVGL